MFARIGKSHGDRRRVGVSQVEQAKASPRTVSDRKRSGMIGGSGGHDGAQRAPYHTPLLAGGPGSPANPRRNRHNSGGGKQERLARRRCVRSTHFHVTRAALVVVTLLLYDIVACYRSVDRT